MAPARFPGETGDVLAAQCVQHRLVHFQHFVHTQTPPVTTVAALVATATMYKPGLQVERIKIELVQPDFFLTGGLVGLATVLTNLAHQPLGNNAKQGTGHQERLHAHINQSHGAADGVVGVQRREHQMAGHRRTQANLGGFMVPHLAHQDHVRVLAQRGAQYTGEFQADFRVYLHLGNARQPVLHRVFCGDDFDFRTVEFG